jgi:hypothetical protein
MSYLDKFMEAADSIPGFREFRGHPKYPFRQLSPGGPEFPKWIPCTACSQPLEYHIDKKCPFEATEFRPDEDTIVMILGEMRLADQKRLDAEEAAMGQRPRNVSTLEDSTRRYLLAFEVVVDTLVGRIRHE